MKAAQKPDHISLNTLIGHLREGRFVIPDFQCEFEWRPWDVRDLNMVIWMIITSFRRRRLENSVLMG